MSKFIEVTLVEYPRAGYSGGYDEPVFHTVYINTSHIEMIKKCIDIKLKDTNSLIKVAGNVNWMKCTDSYFYLKEKINKDE